MTYYTQASSASASIEAKQELGAEVDLLFGEEGENPRRRRRRRRSKSLSTKHTQAKRTQQQKLSNFILFFNSEGVDPAGAKEVNDLLSTKS